MGIQGLLQLLAPISIPIHVKELRGKTVAVDAYAWLHRGTYACAMDLVEGRKTKTHIDFCMKRVGMLRENGVKPFLVFDGSYLPSKASKEGERKARRDENRSMAVKFLRDGQRKEALDCFRKCVDVTPEMAYQLMQECRKSNIPYVVAPFEADAQMAHMIENGTVDAIITEDSDLVVYGCKRIIYKLDEFGNGVEIQIKTYYDADLGGDCSFAGWPFAKFRQMCILAGCDYVDSLKGIGLKTAYKLLKQHGDAEKAIRYLRLTGQPIDSQYELDVKQAELTFLHQVVWDVRNDCLAHLTPLAEGITSDMVAFCGRMLPADLARGICFGAISPISLLPLDPSRAPTTSSTNSSTSYSISSPSLPSYPDLDVRSPYNLDEEPSTSAEIFSRYGSIKEKEGTVQKNTLMSYVQVCPPANPSPPPPHLPPPTLQKSSSYFAPQNLAPNNTTHDGRMRSSSTPVVTKPPALTSSTPAVTFFKPIPDRSGSSSSSTPSLSEKPRPPEEEDEEATPRTSDERADIPTPPVDEYISPDPDPSASPSPASLSSRSPSDGSNTSPHPNGRPSLSSISSFGYKKQFVVPGSLSLNTSEKTKKPFSSPVQRSMSLPSTNVPKPSPQSVSSPLSVTHGLDRSDVSASRSPSLSLSSNPSTLRHEPPQESSTTSTQSIRSKPVYNTTPYPASRGLLPPPSFRASLPNRPVQSKYFAIPGYTGTPLPASSLSSRPAVLSDDQSKDHAGENTEMHSDNESPLQNNQNGGVEDEDGNAPKLETEDHTPTAAKEPSSSLLLTITAKENSTPDVLHPAQKKFLSPVKSILGGLFERGEHRQKHCGVDSDEESPNKLFPESASVLGGLGVGNLSALFGRTSGTNKKRKLDGGL